MKTQPHDPEFILQNAEHQRAVNRPRAEIHDQQRARPDALPERGAVAAEQEHARPSGFTVAVQREAAFLVIHCR